MAFSVGKHSQALYAKRLERRAQTRAKQDIPFQILNAIAVAEVAERNQKIIEIMNAYVEAGESKTNAARLTIDVRELGTSAANNRDIFYKNKR